MAITGPESEQHRGHALEARARSRRELRMFPRRLVALEIFGIGTLFYGLATVAEFFVTGQLSGLLAERRTQRMIDSFTDHVIVCGFGRVGLVGRQVSRDLARAGIVHAAIDAGDMLVAIGRPEALETLEALCQASGAVTRS